MNVNSATVLLLLTALLVGCNDDGNTDTSTPEPTVDKKGWAEQELYHPVTHPDGTFLAAGHTGVLFLEAPTTAPAQGDTATVGEDEIWINLIRGGALALQIDDANLATIARIQLWDEAGGLHGEVDHNQRVAQVTVPPGRYGLRFLAGHQETTEPPLFIRFTEDTTPSASTRVLPQASPSPSVDPVNVQVTLTTKHCENCDLSYANLSGADLSGADLSYADLSEADLSYANLTRANLTWATLPYANVDYANLNSADLSYAHLSHANLSYANLSDAFLNNAFLIEANLSYANLSYAFLNNGTITMQANLSGATWTDGRICGQDQPKSDGTYSGLCL